MIAITNSPQTFSIKNAANAQQRPAFTGLNKAPKAGQVKEAKGLLCRLYKAIFIPRGEQITRFEGGHVYTGKVSKHGSKSVSKKYNVWSRKPIEIIEDNKVTSIRNRRIFNNDGTYDRVIRDMHVPEYKVSVRYDHIDETKGLFDPEAIGGNITINYGDKEVVLDPKTREEVAQKLQSAVSEKFDERVKNVFSRKVDGNKLLNDYYKDPDVIGTHILGSQKDMNKQLELLPMSMPYGIEAIFDKMGIVY